MVGCWEARQFAHLLVVLQEGGRQVDEPCNHIHRLNMPPIPTDMRLGIEGR